MPDASTLDPHQVLKSWLGRVLRGQWSWLLPSGLLINLGLLVTPLLAMLVYDKVVHNGIFETLWALVIGVLVYTALEFTVRTLRVRQTEAMAAQIDLGIDTRLMQGLLRPSARSAAQPGMAARLLTLYRDLAQAREFFSASYFLALADLPFALLIVCAVGLIAWPLMLVLLFWLTLYVVGGLYLKGRAQRVAHLQLQSQTRKLALLNDALSSLDVLRISHAGEHLAARFAQAAQDQVQLSRWLRMELMLAQHWAQLVYLLSFVSMLTLGAYLVFAQWMSTGGLIACNMLAGRVLGVAGQALSTVARWQELQQSFKQLQPYIGDLGLDDHPHGQTAPGQTAWVQSGGGEAGNLAGATGVTGATGALAPTAATGAAAVPSTASSSSSSSSSAQSALPALRRSAQGVLGHVQIDRVMHRFGAAQTGQVQSGQAHSGQAHSGQAHSGREVLRELSLNFAPGERVGLLGRPGSGKSTLLRILAGAIAPTQGQVRVDHIDLQAIALSDRASWLAFKPQESPLLAGTLEHNILLNLPLHASESERLQALQFALYHSSLDDDLARGALSLDHWVEEYGANLSGGQRQKVALARAVAPRPRVLLLDEPTAGLDTESEQRIMQRLSEWPGLSLIMVSHSARALALTQRLVVLEDGRLLADGPTSQLLAKSPA